MADMVDVADSELEIFVGAARATGWALRCPGSLFGNSLRNKQPLRKVDGHERLYRSLLQLTFQRSTNVSDNYYGDSSYRYNPAEIEIGGQFI